MLFTYKNVVSDGQGNQVTVYQGFPIEDVLDFEFLSFYDENTETSQERMLVRLKTQVLSVTEVPKYNKNNVVVRVEKQEKLVPVVHNINFSEDIKKFFIVANSDTVLSTEDFKNYNKDFEFALKEMHTTNRVPKMENKEEGEEETQDLGTSS